MQKLREVSGAWLMRAKKHAWWISIVVVPVLGGVGWWVSGVEATQDEFNQVKAIVPRIDRKLTEISNKQDTITGEMHRGFKEVSDRVSNLEGRVGR